MADQGDEGGSELMQELALKLDLALMELRNIDEALARRPALAGITDRYAKVCRACELAGQWEWLDLQLVEDALFMAQAFDADKNRAAKMVALGEHIHNIKKVRGVGAEDKP